MAVPPIGRFDGVRRLAVFAVVLSVAPGCGSDVGPTKLGVSSVAPTNSPSGVNVTVWGGGFQPGATVTFGGVSAQVVSTSFTSILATVPHFAPGRVDVVVTNMNGESATLVGGFTLTPAYPPLSGTVLEFRETGPPVPVANLRLKVRAGFSGIGAVRATPLADIVTDAQGRYTVNDDTSAAGTLFFQTDPGSGYRFLCDWWVVHRTDPLKDLPVVHTTWSGNRPPRDMRLIGVWGTVFELIDGSEQPVADATVQVADGRLDPPATTRQNGFYMICTSVDPDPGPAMVLAFKTGYNTVTRDASAGSPVHIQLTRK